MKERDHDSVINRESLRERLEEQKGRESQGWGVNRGVAAPCGTCATSAGAQTLGDGASHTGHPPGAEVGDAKPVKQAQLPRLSILLGNLGWG